MNRIIFSFFLLIMPFSTPSFAALLDAGSSIFDTTTGLSWLDFDCSVTDSYADVISSTASSSSCSYGYRIATETEVESLIVGSFGLGDGIGEPREAAHFMYLFHSLAPAHLSPFESLPSYSKSDIFDYIKTVGIGEWASAGYYLTDDGSAAKLSSFFYRMEGELSATGAGYSGYTEYGGISDFGASVDIDSIGGSEVGWFLVKDADYPVSEPTLGILLLGLGCLHFSRRRATKIRATL